MDVALGNDTGQHREDDDSVPSTLMTVITSGVNKVIPLHNRNSQKGRCDEQEVRVPPFIVMPSQLEEGELLKDSRLLKHEGSNSSTSDVEAFTEKIVCNPDGTESFVMSSLSSSHGLFSSSASHVVQTKDDSVASIATTQAAITTVVCSCMCPVASVINLAAASSSQAATSLSSTLNSSTSTIGDTSLVPELEDLANIEKLAQAAAAAAAAAAVVSVPESSKSSPSTPVTNGILDMSSAASNSINQSNTDRTPNSLSPIAKTASNINHHHQHQTSPIPNSNLGTLDDSIDNISPKSTASQSSTNQSSSPIAAGTTPISISACTHRPEGKINGVECPKCDMILGSSRSLGGHMTMMHSRNSCKTLKCPKCNWHYKYQETLEIHMKEKHPENEMTCMFCVTNQPHPRLARGETYTCGYKPYRCEVCNYSTTTKGNLSIHMQSDKHINNVQELSLTPEHIAALQQQLQQQQQQQQQQQLTQTSGSPSAASLGVSSSNAASEALKKSQLSAPKQKANWRCDVCNYETNVARNLRIHMTSEKHTYNMMVLQQNMQHMQHLSAMHQAQAMDPLFQFHPGLLMPADAQLQPKAAIADMAYNHALLMMASQQQQQQHQQQQQQQRSLSTAKQAHMASGPLNLSCSTPAFDLDHTDPMLKSDVPYEDSYKLYQCCVCTIFSSNSLEQLAQHVQLDRSRLREEEVLTVVAGTSICKLCTYKTNLKANFQLHCKTDKHLQRLHHVNHVKEGGPRNEWKLKYVNVSNPVQVRCNSCEYYTNSLHKLQLHITNPRHDANARIFLFLERSESAVRTELKTYHCTMCNVSVRTKVNLVQHVNSLAHLRTENLRQMQGDSEPDMRDVFVVKECKQASPESIKSADEERENKLGEVANETRLSNEEKFKEDKNIFKNSDSSMLKQALLDAHETPQHTCPFCKYTSKSEICIQMHVASKHSAALACPLCEGTFAEWNVLENHVMDTHHVKKENLNKLMALVDKKEWLAAQANSNNSDKQSLECTMQSNEKSLKVVTNGPSTLNSCNQLDLSTKKSDLDLEDPIEVKQELPDIDCRSDTSSDQSKEEDDFACDVCGRVFGQVEDLFCHQNEMGHLQFKATSKGNGFFCWKKGCGLFFGTMTSTQIHFKESHTLRSNIPVSEKHVYRYRCTQCSLAFKTSEKLSLHMQYHIIRAATKCVICGRSFRTIPALQKHVEAFHVDMTKEELEQYRASLMNYLLLGNGGTTGGILDPQTTELLKKESNRDELDDELPDENARLPDDDDAIEDGSDDVNESKEQVLEDYINSQAIAEDSYNDPNRKYKCHRCKVAFTRQSYLTSHNKTLLHRKGEKMSYPMEKYLDPNRPFKCEICKESFTEKNVLLFHYNSVSHLKKFKLSKKDNKTSVPVSLAVTRNSSKSIVTTSTTVSSTASTNFSQVQTAEDTNKPYKCNLCKLSYSHAANLEIHVRSVLHQSKAARVQELVLSGHLDLSVPLVERPDSAPPVEQHQAKSVETASTTAEVSSSKTTTTVTQTSKTPEIQPFSVTTSTTISTSASIPPINSSPQFPFPLHPDHNNIMQQALGLVPHASLMQSQAPPFSCNRCGSMCSSQEALMQHQQLNCFFAQSQLPPMLNFQNHRRQA